MPQKYFEKLTGVQVFLETKSHREFVGILTRENHTFHFIYDNKYLNSTGVIPLGPEMPLTKRSFQSNTLFVPFLDRIPSRENPAYADYCIATGITLEESDPMTLLISIAHRGPSSFIFEPLYKDSFNAEDFRNFRKMLNLTVKEFSICFGFSPAAITRVELGQSSGREILKRAEIYVNYPQVALDQIQRNGGILHTKKRLKVESFLRKSSEINTERLYKKF